jgi:hypothetical protein
VDNACFSGVRLDKEIWGSFDVSLDYQYTRLNSNVLLNSYYRNIIMLGLCNGTRGWFGWGTLGTAKCARLCSWSA